MCSREIHSPSSTCIHNVWQIEKQFLNVLLSLFHFFVHASPRTFFVFSHLYAFFFLFCFSWNSSYAVTRQAKRNEGLKASNFLEKIVFFFVFFILLQKMRRNLRIFRKNVNHCHFPFYHATARCVTFYGVDVGGVKHTRKQNRKTHREYCFC